MKRLTDLIWWHATARAGRPPCERREALSGTLQGLPSVLNLSGMRGSKVVYADD